MFKHFVNLMIKKFYLNKIETAQYEILNPEMYDVFKVNGEGLYYSICQAGDGDGSSKLIGNFCKGLSHTICILYSENIQSWFTQSQWEKIKVRWFRYYGSLRGLSECKTLILASADAIGTNYLDFSSYQDRRCVMRKIPNQLYSKDIQQQVAQWFVEVPYNSAYDFVGLFGQIISHKIYEREDYYCSREVYDGFKSMNIFIADRVNPKPNMIHDYNKDWVCFNTLDLHYE